MHKTHFGEKNAFEHVVEKRIEGEKAFLETHGEGAPEPFAKGADALREMALFLGLILIIFGAAMPMLLIISALGFATWKVGRSCWQGWSGLERLHRVIEQEKYEIEHHRPQEKEELMALYRAKGFEGRLLEEVVEVLMADQDRLLKVMLEEEMGLTLAVYEHPLKQGLGVLCGCVAGAVLPFLALFLFGGVGMVIASLAVIGIGAFVTAAMEKNKVIPAVVWNMAIAIVAFGITYFFLNLLTSL